jgi:hypothetical protein
VLRLKCAMSSGKCQGKVLLIPITPLEAWEKISLSCMVDQWFVEE